MFNLSILVTLANIMSMIIEFIEIEESENQIMQNRNNFNLAAISGLTTIIALISDMCILLFESEHEFQIHEMIQSLRDYR